MQAFVCGGTGNIGTFLVSCLRDQALPYHKNITLYGYANSKSVFLAKNSFEPVPYGDLMEHIESNGIVIDCTGSDSLPAALYSRLLKEKNAKLVLCNKVGLTLDNIELFEQLFEGHRNGRVFFESTVMAGIPVISTLSNLTLNCTPSHDKILSIEAVLSGTLSFLFNELNSSKSGADSSFTSVLNVARERGYTEPDYWIDLSGVDVARKVLIMGRMIGFKSLTLSDIKLEGVASAQSSNLDESFKRRIGDAKKRGNFLHYVGSISEDGTCQAGIREFQSSDHPFSQLRGTQCAILIKTKWFPEGIYLQGAGAGRESTVFGILSDLVRFH